MNRYFCIISSITLILFVLGCTAGTDTSSRTEAREMDDTTAPPVERQRASEEEHRILFFGNSITAGYGVDPGEAFPARVEEKIDSLGWSFEVLSRGYSGETSAGGLRRIGWVMDEEIDVMVLELGGNDGLRGTPVNTTKKNLGAIIDSARAVNPNIRVLLAGMQVPPNLGKDYAEAFRNIYPELASEKNVELIPFVLEGVGGVDELNQPDGIHPTAEGHRIIAETVWEHLRPVLEEVREEASAGVGVGSVGSMGSVGRSGEREKEKSTTGNVITNPHPPISPFPL